MELARDRELSPATGRVALYIWSHNADWDQSAKDVAENLGMDRGAVARALLDLQVHGWLIREILTRPGRAKPVGEKWHLQMSNTRFTPQEIAALGGADSPGTLRVKPAPPIETLLVQPAPPCCSIQHPPAVKCRTIEVHLAVHEVHAATEVQQGVLVKPVDVASGSADADRNGVAVDASHVGSGSSSERLSTGELVGGGLDDVASGEYVAGLWPDEPSDEYFDNEEAARYELVSDDFEAKEPW